MNATWKDRLIPAGLIALSLVPALAGTARVVELTTGAEVTAANARFFAAPLPVLLHIPAAILYSIVGAFQFAPGFRRRHRDWHRAAGRVLLGAGLLVAVTGLWMTQSYEWAAGDGFAVYAERLVFGTGMLVSLLLGIDAIRRRDFTAHGEWMIRGYALGLGAGTQVLTHLPWFLLVGLHPGELARGIMMGAGWVINLLFAEWVIHRGRRARRAAAVRRASGGQARDQLAHERRDERHGGEGHRPGRREAA